MILPARSTDVVFRRNKEFLQDKAHKTRGVIQIMLDNVPSPLEADSPKQKRYYEIDSGNKHGGEKELTAETLLVMRGETSREVSSVFACVCVGASC